MKTSVDEVGLKGEQTSLDGRQRMRGGEKIVR